MLAKLSVRGTKNKIVMKWSMLCLQRTLKITPPSSFGLFGDTFCWILLLAGLLLGLGTYTPSLPVFLTGTIYESVKLFVASCAEAPEVDLLWPITCATRDAWRRLEVYRKYFQTFSLIFLFLSKYLAHVSCFSLFMFLTFYPISLCHFFV